MSIVYDGFVFFNEVDLLDLRLRHLQNDVDVFVICEATKTFTVSVMSWVSLVDVHDRDTVILKTW